MTKTILDNIINEFITTSGQEETIDFTIIPVNQLVDRFNHSDVTLWLSWAGGLLLSDTLRRIEELRNTMPEIGEDDEETEMDMWVEDQLSEEEKAVVYGAYLLSGIPNE